MGEKQNEEPLQADWVEELTRRKALLGAFVGSLVAAYAVITSFALRFIFPTREPTPPRRIFIGFTREIGAGESKSMPLPSGDQLIVSNTGRINPDTGSPYIGFSNQCPHLGCKVHWQGKEQQFLCPCHQGVFNPEGTATEGPPAAANQKLRSYPIALDGQSMYVLIEEDV